VSDKPILILGAGLAGLSAAYHLGGGYRVFEREDRVGGLCRSETHDGFTFDYAIHILYSSDPYATDLIRNRLLKDNFHEQARSSWVSLLNVFTYYPFQANTYGLPVEVIKECVLGLIEATYERDPSRTSNFKEWIHATFGDGIARYFMLPFNEKCWAIDLDRMSIGWIKDRVLQPEIEEVLHGALTDQRKGFGPNASFWYPQHGGIESLPRGFLPSLDPKRIHLGKRIVEVSLRDRTVRVSDGETVPFDRLISTLPLPRLISLVRDLPESWRETVDRLEYNTIWGVNLGINRPRITDKHWIYYPEKEYLFHRISFPMNFHPSLAPPGTSSITAEVAMSRHKPAHRETLVEDVIRDLKRTPFLTGEDEILTRSVLELTPAYVIYHLQHREDVDALKRFLLEYGIHACGRFGDWEYLNMDHSILSGKRAAEDARRRP
jgi:protoporphyrinogen oxidase